MFEESPRVTSPEGKSEKDNWTSSLLELKVIGSRFIVVALTQVIANSSANIITNSFFIFRSVILVFSSYAKIDAIIERHNSTNKATNPHFINFLLMVITETTR